LRITN